jgi:hypothetical protein
MPEQSTCPFPQCPKSYATATALKSHLLKVRGGKFNELHPEDDELWSTLDDDGFLTFHTRPGSLSREEKTARRKATQRRHYQSNKGDIIRSRKRKRNEFHDTLRLTERVGIIAREAISELKKAREIIEQMQIQSKRRGDLLKKLYGPKPSLPDVILNLTSPLTLGTFAMLAAYLLPPSTWPASNSAGPLIMDNIPGNRHYRQISLRFHPDKSTESQTGLQAYLNSAFDLWRPLLMDCDLSKVALSEKANLEERGGKFVKLETMYDEFVVARRGAMNLLNTTMNLLNTTNLSVWQLKEGFDAADHCDRLNENLNMAGLLDPDVGELIAKALNPSGGIGRGRKQRANRTANEDNHVEEDEDILE